MNSPHDPPVITDLLQRGDIWKGAEQTAPQQYQGLDTGFIDLNRLLAQGGWPQRQLIELNNPVATQAEWWLMQEALLKMDGLLVLVNPPATPLAQAMIQSGFDLDKLLIVESLNRADFLASFIELTRSLDCGAVMGWQGNFSLTYTDLRKCLLACQQGHGLYLLCRPLQYRNQSSPASLRISLQLTAENLLVDIYKQKGQLKMQSQPVALDLPVKWKLALPHAQLDQTGQPSRKPAPVIQFPIQSRR